MRVVTLIAKSKRGKQIVKQHGERWEVVQSKPQVLFSDRPGPWLYIQPLSEERAPASDVRSSKVESAARWAHEHFDDEFKIAP